jgi:hypothetical protein
MSVVTTSQAWPAAGRPFTVAELDRMPDDGRRYELLDGALVVSQPELTILELRDGRYALAAEASGPITVGPGAGIWPAWIGAGGAVPSHRSRDG